MKIIATIKQADGQMYIELTDEAGELIDRWPIDKLNLTQGAYRESHIIREDDNEQG